MTPHEVCAECRRWFEGEAEGLPEDVRQWALRVLAERHERLCCDRLFELRDAGRLPKFWDKTLERFWEASR